MSRSETPIYRFDAWEVDAAQACLRHDGEARHLRHKTFQVLLYLLQQRARVVSKEELFGHVWADVAVTDDALTKCVMDIRKTLGDDPRQPRFIQTIAKSGYRFIAPVEELSPSQPAGMEQVIEEIWWGRTGDGPTLLAEVEEITSVEVIDAGQPEFAVGAAMQPRLNESPHRLTSRRWLPELAARLRRPVVALPILALFLLPIVGVWIYRQRVDARRVAEIALPHVAGKRAVAVLWFDNRSGSHELDWLRAGLADMLIANLARSPQLAVLSRQQLHVLLDRTGHASDESITLPAALELAGKAQAEVIALGSFAQLGQRVRLDVQLHDARTGQLLAAESSLAEAPEQILSQVDLLSLKLAAHLQAAPAQPSTRLADVMTGNLEAYRDYSLAVAKMHAFHSIEAIQLLEQAIALDDQFAMAYARLGYAYVLGGFRSESARARQYLETAYRLTQRLTERDRLYILTWYSFAHFNDDQAIGTLREITRQYPLDVEAYYSLSYTLRNAARLEESIEVIRQGLTIDPEAPDLYNRLGFCLAELGRYDEARRAHERYVQLVPREANAYDSLGSTCNEMGRFVDALAAFDQALALSPDFGLAVMHKGDVYVRQGRYREARAQYERALPLLPASYHRGTAYHRLARLALSRGARHEAEEAARQELKLGQSGGAFLAAIARGDLTTAERLRARDVEASADRPHQPISGKWQDYCLGLLAMKSGRAEEALNYFRSVTRRPPLTWNTDNGAEDCLADALLELGRLDEASAEYERLLRINPSYALAHYGLGQACERKGDHARARAAYEQFLQLWRDADADLPAVVNARARLAALP